MYNGIGLQTARGSGTNGYVQRNLSHVKQTKDKVGYRTEEEIRKMDEAANRAPNREILEHERKRNIEVECAKLESTLESQGYPADAIEEKVAQLRKQMLEKSIQQTPVLEMDEFGRPIVKDSHQIAEANLVKNQRARDAFGISKFFIEGSSLDPARKAKEAMAAAASVVVGGKTNSAAAPPVPKKYALIRDKSPGSSRSRSSSSDSSSSSSSSQSSTSSSSDSSSSESAVDNKRKRSAKKSKKKRRRRSSESADESRHRRHRKKKRGHRHKTNSKKHKRERSDSQSVSRKQSSSKKEKRKSRKRSPSASESRSKVKRRRKHQSSSSESSSDSEYTSRSPSPKIKEKKKRKKSKRSGREKGSDPPKTDKHNRKHKDGGKKDKYQAQHSSSNKSVEDISTPVRDKPEPRIYRTRDGSPITRYPAESPEPESRQKAPPPRSDSTERRLMKLSQMTSVGNITVAVEHRVGEKKRVAEKEESVVARPKVSPLPSRQDSRLKPRRFSSHSPTPPRGAVSSKTSAVSGKDHPKKDSFSPPGKQRHASSSSSLSYSPPTRMPDSDSSPEPRSETYKKSDFEIKEITRKPPIKIAALTSLTVSQNKAGVDRDEPKVAERKTVEDTAGRRSSVSSRSEMTSPEKSRTQESKVSNNNGSSKPTPKKTLGSPAKQPPKSYAKPQTSSPSPPSPKRRSRSRSKPKSYKNGHGSDHKSRSRSGSRRRSPRGRSPVRRRTASRSESRSRTRSKSSRRSTRSRSRKSDRSSHSRSSSRSSRRSSRSSSRSTKSRSRTGSIRKRDSGSPSHLEKRRITRSPERSRSRSPSYRRRDRRSRSRDRRSHSRDRYKYRR